MQILTDIALASAQKAVRDPKARPSLPRKWQSKAKTKEPAITRGQVITKWRRRAVRLQAGRGWGRESSENQGESRSMA